METIMSSKINMHSPLDMTEMIVNPKNTSIVLLSRLLNYPKRYHRMHKITQKTILNECISSFHSEQRYSCLLNP